MLAVVGKPRDQAAMVLVVEDDPGIQITVRLSLEVGGFAVTVVPSAEEALETLDGLEPAAILLDISLPGMDGWAFLERLRADGRLEELGVIVMSAHVSHEIAARAEAAGAQAHLSKPFDVDELIETVGRVAAQRPMPPGR
jgi:CheY-like chemotaxis protein